MKDEKKNAIEETLKERNGEIAALEAFFGENPQKEVDYISEKLNMEPELIQKALDAADEFAESAVDHPEYIIDDVDEDGLPIKVISGEAMMEYAVEKTGIDSETLDKIYDCEVDYFDQFGLVD